jgi:hypothetical protein
MIEIKAPNTLDLERYKKVFLAGSIEMDTAEHWQKRLIKEFENEELLFINPRRDNWDITWAEDDPQFIKQVNWELNAIEDCEVVLVYFDPKTQSPITLLELGIIITSDKDIIVCCPEGFWRRGNVKIVCQRNRVPFTNTFEEFVELINKELGLK